jgi:hypothetical protein
MCGLLGEVAVIIRKLGLNMIVILLVGGGLLMYLPY